MLNLDDSLIWIVCSKRSFYIMVFIQTLVQLFVHLLATTSHITIICKFYEIGVLEIPQQNTIFLVHDNIFITYLLSLAHTKSWSEMKIRRRKLPKLMKHILIYLCAILYPHFLPTLAWNKVLCFKWLFLCCVC